MPVRSLLGPLANSHKSNLPPADGSWHTFGAADADVHVGPADSWQTIQRRLPADARPEALVVVLGEEALPVGLWSAPLPLVALLPDGPARWHRDRRLLARCDLVVCTAPDAGRLRRLGIERLHTPGRWHQPPPEPQPDPEATPRDIDLLFLGDLHPARQRRRMPSLARLTEVLPFDWARKRAWRVGVLNTHL